MTVLFYKFVISKFPHRFTTICINENSIAIHFIVLKLSYITTAVGKDICSNTIGLVIHIWANVYFTIRQSSFSIVEFSIFKCSLKFVFNRI